MFQEPTVLILGAGASAPYGYPLGDQLLANIVDGLSTLRDTNLRHGPSEDFIRRPYETLKSVIFSRKPALFGSNFLQQGIFDLLSDLNANHRTIDEFVRIHPRWRSIVKSLVALEISRASIEPDPKSPTMYRFLRKITEPNRISWYGDLVNELKRGARNAHDLAENQLSIITFNYDTSLEYHLKSELPRGEIFEGFSMNDVPSINHIHGEIVVDLAAISQPILFWDAIERSVERFAMIDEPKGRPDTLISGARIALNTAERIFILGFDLHEDNVRILGLNDSKIARKCILLNWDGTRRVTLRAQDAGINIDQNMRSGTPSAPLGISTAISNGLFLERP